MTEKYKPKDGDRVRVLLEGEVHRTGGDDPSDFTIGANLVYGNSKWVVSIEKVEPPVVTFGPGQTVRGKFNGAVYTIDSKGYYYHAKNPPPGFSGWCEGVGLFTSDKYELVSL